jgi:hypothetical protein
MQPEIKLRLTSGDPLRCHLPQRHQLRLVVREPRCSICREHHTICTAIAPDEVRTVRM